LVFKRRDKRSVGKLLLDSVYPRGGWGRAAYYISHRLRRLPDTPRKIGRGIFAGVFAVFTPFYGLHFLIAALLAKAMRGNILASLLSTLVGNPLTYVPIGVASLKLGHFLLGTRFDENVDETLVAKFTGAASDLKNNFLALFTDAVPHWARLSTFYHEVFLPYMVGGILLGLVAALISYYVSVPLLSAYQNRRRGRLKKKLSELRASAAAKAEDRG